MSEVASLDLSKELYELSGWGYTYHAYGSGKHDLTQNQWYWFEGKTTGSFWEAIKTDFNDRDPFDGRRPTSTTHRMGLSAPAYDLGYLLRKLPLEIDNDRHLNQHLELLPLTIRSDAVPKWAARYLYTAFFREADTPEDALCKLAIELFKQGVLTKEVV